MVRNFSIYIKAEKYTSCPRFILYCNHIIVNKHEIDEICQSPTNIQQISTFLIFYKSLLVTTYLRLQSKSPLEIGCRLKWLRAVRIHCRPFVNAANFEPSLGNRDERNFSLFAPLQYVTSFYLVVVVSSY